MEMEDTLKIVLSIICLNEARKYLEIMATGRRYWVRPLFSDRDDNGYFARNFEEMYFGDSEQFKKTTRMSKAYFDLLFELLKEKLEKNSNRASIPAKCRLFLTLAYLAHGGGKHMYSSCFKMGLSTVRNIVEETCSEIWTVLGPIYLAIPQEHEWLRIAQDFHSMWHFPNCVGAIDGKHIITVCPPNSGSQFFNYKGRFSIVLLATCDANYNFTYVDIGAYGSQSDGGVLRNSGLWRKLEERSLGLPADSPLPGSNTIFPYFFIGDSAFPVKPFLMPVFKGNLTPERMAFNQRLSRERRVIENAFGILTARWRILLSPLQMNPENAEKIVKATVVLHNFIKRHDNTYCPQNYVDQYNGDNMVPGLWRQEVANSLQGLNIRTSNNAPVHALNLRNILMNYICEIQL